MTMFKSGNGYYLDKDIFSAVNSDDLWVKLYNYVNKNLQVTDFVSYDKDKSAITLTSTNGRINPIIKINVNHELKLNKSVIRVLQLNTVFDKANKGLALSTENVENFENYNTISYQVICENKKIGNLDSLFFHESALVDYTKNFNADEYIMCTHFVAIIELIHTHKEINTMESAELHTTVSNDIIFFCYDSSTDKMLDIDFNVMNADIVFDLNSLKEKFNNHIGNWVESSENENTIIVDEYEYRYAVSNFKLVRDEEREFLNFKSFNSLMYEKFIKNLKLKLTNRI